MDSGNPDYYEFSCGNIPKLTVDQVNSISLKKHIGNNIYLENLDNIRVYVKYDMYENDEQFDLYVCQYDDIILGVWMDPNSKRKIVVMKYSPRPREPFVNLESKFNTCPYKYTHIDCVEQISEDLVKRIVVGERITCGCSANIYRAKLDNKKMIIKLGQIDTREICIQDFVSKYNMAPRVYAYWKCLPTGQSIMIMDEVKGMTVSDYISEKNDADIIETFLNIVKSTLYLGIELKVKHNDLHTDNIIITPNKSV